MSRVLVTGGTGYLGGRIVDFLAGQGHSVKSGTRRKSLAGDGIHVYTNFDDQVDLTRSFGEFDAIVHLAGMNEIDASTDPEAAILTTANYTVRALKASKDNGIGKFIYFSTAHVYGSPLRGVLDEQSPTFPTHPYSITHRASEDFVYEAHVKSELSTVIFRLSNGFGFPMDKNVNRWTLLVNDLCKQLAISGKITLKSPGIQYRDFITLHDVCRAVEFFLDKSKLVNPFFNLGSGTSIRIIDMAEAIADRYEAMTGQKPIMDIPEAKDDSASDSFQFSIQKLLDEGFEITNDGSFEIDEMLKRCSVWYSD